MIWASLRNGIFTSNYTPDMISGPAEPVPKKSSAAPYRVGDDSPGRDVSRGRADPDPSAQVGSASPETSYWNQSQHVGEKVPSGGARWPRRAEPQRAITPSRLGRNMVVARRLDPTFATLVPGSRPGSQGTNFRSGSASPTFGPGSPIDGENSISWWNCSRATTPRLVSDRERPNSSEGKAPARSRQRMYGTPVPLPPMSKQPPRRTSEEWGGGRTSAQFRSSDRRCARSPRHFGHSGTPCATAQQRPSPDVEGHDASSAQSDLARQIQALFPGNEGIASAPG
ncbi:unnamed protein product, partial [Polarella glacialis]